MAIKSIIVHPKGATHIQKLITRDYFMKLIGGVWFYYAEVVGIWFEDTGANEGNFACSYLGSLIHPIR